ncbi:MAG: hypothetical protein HS128_03285 [Ideonella sp.]|nr:hypothetical protein [Ideonella sp.]
MQSDSRGTHADNPEAFFLQRYRDPYRLEITHFFEVLRSGGAFGTSISDGVEARRLADAAALSNETGPPVTM